MMHKVRIYIIVVVIFLFGGHAFAFVQMDIGPQEAKIKSSIRYSVIGKYRAEFDNYSGNIVMNWVSEDIRSVNLNIQSASIRSNCGWCDKIVRSKRLLFVDKFPQITFTSNSIVKNSDGYQVVGDLNFHGVTKELSFPFIVERIKEQGTGVINLNAKGQWIINRKEFNVTWNKLLDKGGILVGDTITVDWEITIANQS